MIDIMLLCLSLTLYHEARGEGIDGMHAVAHVIMNRVADPRWPDDICAVTRQDDQFSWIREVNPLPDDTVAWNRAVFVSFHVMDGAPDNTGGATNYHKINKHNIVPYWVRELTETKRIGSHVFYK